MISTDITSKGASPSGLDDAQAVAVIQLQALVTPDVTLSVRAWPDIATEKCDRDSCRDVGQCCLYEKPWTAVEATTFRTLVLCVNHATDFVVRQSAPGACISVDVLAPPLKGSVR